MKLLNVKIIIIMLLIWAVGICAGSFSEVYLAEDTKDQLASLLSGFFSGFNADSGTEAKITAGGFIKSFAASLPFIITAAISPFIFITVPLIPVFIFIRGLSAGFSAAMTLEVLGIRGMVSILVYLMPACIIHITASVIMGTLAIEATSARGNALLFHGVSGPHRKRKALHYNARLYFIYYLSCVAAIIISCLLEVFLPPLIF